MTEKVHTSLFFFNLESTVTIDPCKFMLFFILLLQVTAVQQASVLLTHAANIMIIMKHSGNMMVMHVQRQYHFEISKKLRVVLVARRRRSYPE